MYACATVEGLGGVWGPPQFAAQVNKTGCSLLGPVECLGCMVGPVFPVLASSKHFEMAAG